MPSANQTIRVLDRRECFEILPDGSIEFRRTKILFRLGNQTCCGYVMTRERREDIQLDEINSINAIPLDSYRPLLPPSITVCNNPPAQSHLKQPDLMSYEQGSDMSETILREVEVCELLLRHPHRNVASYIGCQVTDRRIDGIYFKRYPVSLMEKLNPKSLNKSMFVQSRTLPPETAQRYLLGIEAGINHLHSLGFVHNDLNPSNVMISEDDTAIIIDFDSCVKIGEPVDAAKIKRTHGWYNRGDQMADVNNDLAALQELRIWLESTHPEEFQYRDT